MPIAPNVTSTPPAPPTAPDRPLAEYPPPPAAAPAPAPAVGREYDPVGRHKAPTSLADVGVPAGLLEDMLLRRLLIDTRSSTMAMADDLALSFSVVHRLTEELRDKQYLEILGLQGHEYRFTLTDAGRAFAQERARISLYAGPAPVSVADYREVVEGQRRAPRIDRSTTRAAFADLVLGDPVIRRIGGALLNEGAIFLYGPPGTGKTSLAERMNRLLAEPILVPHAVEADGNVILVFDPAVHRPVPRQPEGLDPRWVLCERPLLLVGGELTLAMLDLSYEDVSGTYSAPLQMMANNGILVIDDFGRQLISPEEILNRWIVPLSRDVDFLKLNTGSTFEVPFAAKLVISSNFNPNDLGDDAFLRRLRNKIYVGGCSPEQFDRILESTAAYHGVQLDPRAFAHLQHLAMEQIGELRPYLANDFCDLLRGICAFDERPLLLDPDTIDLVAEVYFVDDSGWSQHERFSQG